MIEIPKITATINTEEVETVELPPIVATIETKENFVELPKVVADIRPETSIVGNFGTMVAGKGKDGKDGYTPVKGVDYFDGKDGVDGYTPVKGIDYFDGKDGYTPIKGVDYFDGEKGDPGYTPIKGIDYFDGQPGQPGRDGVDGKPGKDGKNGRTPIKGIDYKDGKDGLNGLNGTDGFSPKVLVEEIEGGHKITITDKDGEKSFDVMDGQGGNGDGGAGENGFSPTISVEEIENGHKITITDIEGTKTIDVLNGKNGIDGKDGYTPIKNVDYFDGASGADGQPGADGYTPQRGKDYWTDADKKAILEELAAQGSAGIKSEIVVLSDVTLTKGALLENQIITFPTKHCNADNYICKFLISSWPKQTWTDAFVFNVHSDCTYVIGTPGTLFAYNQFGLATMATQKYDLIAQFIYYDK